MQRPRILHIFSRYGEVGGEEICFHAITEALGAIADVTPFVYSTEELFHSPHGALTKMGYLLHNRDVEQKLRECLRENRYDAWIIHNTFPAMSPCVYELALHQPAPVIHYMHNYRSGCLNGVFYRDGAPCFSCQGGNYFPGIMHACWRKNAAYSSLAAAVLYKTRRMGAWSRFSSYIAISRRQRELLIQTGIPEDKIRVIPHFIRQNPAPSAGPPRRDVLYAGRLTQEKGVLQLVQAWELLSPPGRILYLMGDAQGRHGQNAAVFQAVCMPRHHILFPVQSHAYGAAVTQNAPDMERRAPLYSPVHNSLPQQMVGQQAHIPCLVTVGLQRIK